MFPTELHRTSAVLQSCGRSGEFAEAASFVTRIDGVACMMMAHEWFMSFGRLSLLLTNDADEAFNSTHLLTLPMIAQLRMVSLRRSFGCYTSSGNCGETRRRSVRDLNGSTLAVPGIRLSAIYLQIVDFSRGMLVMKNTSSSSRALSIVFSLWPRETKLTPRDTAGLLL